MSTHLIRYIENYVNKHKIDVDVSIARRLITYKELTEKFCVPIELLVELGIDSSIEQAKHRLIKSFIKNKDYIVIKGEINPGNAIGSNDKKMSHAIAQSYKTILLTVDCFKICCLLANNDVGKKIRLYYIKVEKIFDQWVRVQQQAETQQIVPIIAVQDKIALTKEKRLEFETGLNLIEKLGKVMTGMNLMDDTDRVIIHNCSRNLLQRFDNYSRNTGNKKLIWTL